MVVGLDFDTASYSKEVLVVGDGGVLSLFRVLGESTLFLRPKLMLFSVSIVKRLGGVVACLAGRGWINGRGLQKGRAFLFYYSLYELDAFSLRTGTPPRSHTLTRTHRNTSARPGVKLNRVDRISDEKAMLVGATDW